ncbi:uncharacterized protein LOC113273007 [Papaver somniferum]|uniref:uncharacterized protein LOC113273007 n=1 Tax=Papaver somniferum TaxID=3469 RepID=UPI000E6FE525|nr:uncharacterized protein LOC113273007 [Papaver somniferum]
MEQPKGFVDVDHPIHFCKLNKAIYDLKQAPRAWFDKFKSFLIAQGFIISKSDHSLFIYFFGSGVLLLLIYVDDILLIGSSEFLLSSFFKKLSTVFSMKDLGDLHYFLGIEVKHDSSTNSLVLTQSKYTVELLQRTGMIDCKPCNTPVANGLRAPVNDGELLSDPTEYRNIVGALQYLTLTRPDITFGVNYTFQFMHAPRTTHMLLVKRILRYLKASLGSGITFSSGNITSLTGYSDSDWAGFPDTRKSIAGYCVFLGNSLISWQSKKHPTVLKSSIEVEYEDLTLLAVEVMWLSTLLSELNVPLETPYTLYCDMMEREHLQPIQYFILGLNTLRWITILFVICLKLTSCPLPTFLHRSS